MKTKKSKPLKAIPLLCWDVYKMQEYTMNLNREDMRQLDALATEKGWKHSWNFEEKLFRQKKTILVTDTRQQIVFASNSLYDMAGYTPAEVLGKTPHLFQGPETSSQVKEHIRNAIAQKQPFSGTLTNYRKNKEPYNCYIEGFPVFNRKGDLMNYIAFETELS
ncbi:PAS domain-containing protein [Cesiribacter sp. SM1]|uniref:PAS domain-containing protein n=1 Tax=Cesiribacter sp. SM1 TaxID=2861196 RepID=UPI001CD38039|nr:PAS domain-containing protein [Cesiribacter sp. SM1]